MAESKYPTKVKPRLNEIKQWYKDGVSQRVIATRLGLGHTTFQGYKKLYPELKELLIDANKIFVEQLEEAMNKVALGYTYETEETYTEITTDKDGNEVPVFKSKKIKRYQAPDTRALIYLLNNKARDTYSNNPQFLELKKKALELQEKHYESKEW